MDYVFLVALLSIVWIDLLLSGDNAVVIALVSRKLPAHQQKWGIIGGTVAAIVLRLAMAFVAASLLGIPGLSIAGGLFLLWVAAKLVMDDDDETGDAKPATSLLAAICTIAVADASMSLDNVMAVAALAHGNGLLMGLGILLSIPMVIAGSAIISMVIGRFPVLKWAGAALLGWVAGGIIASDPWSFGETYFAAVICTILVIGAGMYKKARK